MMRNLLLAIALVSLVSPMQVSSGHAQDVAPCAPAEAPILDTLYFRDGTVAPPGCYPIAAPATLVRMADARRDSRYGARPICRPAYPSADVRDDVLTNISAW